MQRVIYDEFLTWKRGGMKKPLMVLGVRQAGKTYSIREFCKNEFKDFEEINFLARKDIVDIYKSGLSSEEKFRSLAALLSINLEKKSSILFVDEIQESGEFIESLKFIREEHGKANIVCAGSLLGVMLKRENFSFPVGNINMINMLPMNFKEFLLALSHEKLIPLIEEAYENDSPLAPSIHEKLMLMHRSFLYIGGMPESVKSFAVAEEDITKYDETILGDIVEAYFKDMAKYVTNKNEAVKISRVYKSIPKQLLSVANKFTYSTVSKGGRGRDYLSSIDWLLSNGMVMESKKVKSIEIPIFSFSTDEIFKLYLSDPGILSYLCELSYADFIRGDIGMYSGALAENYVANTLAASGVPLYFWESEGKAEIDFLMQKDGAIIPIEAKAGERVVSKSLNIYMKRFNPKYGIRISAKNFGFENGIKSVPLYAAFCVK